MASKKKYGAYHYLFYKFCSWYARPNCEKDPFAYQAGWYVLSFLIYINFLAFLGIFEIFTGNGYHQLLRSRAETLILLLGILYLNYFGLIFKKKYKKIFKSFQDENRKARIRGNVFAWVYVIFTFGLITCIGFVMQILKINLK